MKIFYNNASIRKFANKDKIYIVYYLLLERIEICEGCFKELRHITTISIPPTITTICKCGFYECKSLKKISMPSSIISIGDSAFRGCSSLTEIIIPMSVKSIGQFAFDIVVHR